MKKSELRQIIREEIQKSLIKENTGLITFEEVKQACIDTYTDYVNSFDEDEDEEPDQQPGAEINNADDINELVNILDGMGFNGDEAYDFIFDAILKY